MQQSIREATLPRHLHINPRPAILLGLATILFAFGGLGTWAAVAPIASAVIASGVVTVDSNRKKVQHPEGGVVKELLVRDGDVVQAGELLIRLDETRPKANLAILQGRYDASRAVEARLLAERDGAARIRFPCPGNGADRSRRQGTRLPACAREHGRRRVALFGERGQ